MRVSDLINPLQNTAPAVVCANLAKLCWDSVNDSERVYEGIQFFILFDKTIDLHPLCKHETVRMSSYSKWEPRA
jgi:hypothetical protein